MDEWTIRPELFTAEEALLNGAPVRYRAARELLYAARPVCPAYQTINVFVPEPYYHGGSVNGYTASSAPVLLANMVNGYKASKAWGPGLAPRGNRPNIALWALAHGCVVACPGVRGRQMEGEHKENAGCAPAAILDLKAAVRFLRHNAGRIPGDMEKIIATGVSAGGGLAALLGSGGDHPDYAPALMSMGAAEERDDVFAVLSYCPVTNLGHIDEAFEWMFSACPGYIRPERFGMDMAALPTIPFSPEQRRHHEALAARFPAYVSSLKLHSADGTLLALEEDGSGIFSDYLLEHLLRCVQSALDRDADATKMPWVTEKDGRAIVDSLPAYTNWLRRVKPPVGYDALDASSDENELFRGCHFSRYGGENDTAGAAMAEPEVLKQMDPMAYIGEPCAVMAKHWRFRYGVLDRGSSPAIALLLALKAAEAGAETDFAFAWGVGHMGYYDLPELFSWIDDICK